MTRYNGWANRETWLVNLWFGDAWADESPSADYIREVVEEYVYEQIAECSFIADMIDLGCIDWQGLEQHYSTEEAA